ncbi:MAG: ATP-binding protein [Lentisphaeria bacterium]|nr:ATP-binding protein [Lentisphaeria bacterium]
MPKSDSDFIDRLIERLDQLDANSIQSYILKLGREKGILETVFQSIREGIVIIDRDLEIIYTNQAATQLLGFPQQVVGTRINRYIRALDWERLMNQDPLEWERISRQELEVFYPRYRNLLFYLLPYQDDVLSEDSILEDDFLDMAILIFHDVTEMRQSAEKEIESERLNAITLLAAGVAHEIGNPLNSLNIHLQLLNRYFKSLPINDETDDAREMVHIALEEVSRLDQIINRFLKAIRPTPLEMERLILKDILTDTLRILQKEIENNEIEVECDWGVAIPTIHGDAGQLKQAFYNLINNAMQATPVKGKVKIAIVANSENVLVSIMDNGKGISKEQIGNIFDPYYTDREGGTGLGLVIVQRIIRQHGGELGVESALNKGTIFTVNFPLNHRKTNLLEAPAIKDIDPITATINSQDFEV